MDLLTLSMALMELNSIDVILTTSYVRLSLITLLGIMKACRTIQTTSRILNVFKITDGVKIVLSIIVIVVLLHRILKKDFSMTTAITTKDLQMLLNEELVKENFIFTASCLRMSLRLII